MSSEESGERKPKRVKTIDVEQPSDAASPLPVETLSENHLFKMIYRGFLDVTPVDWTAVLARLQSEEGKSKEIKDLVLWCPVGRLVQPFLHHLVGHTKLPTVEVLRTAIEAYPEALHIRDSNGSYPLHLLCGNSGAKRSTGVSFSDLFHLLFRAWPGAVKCVNQSNETVLHKLFDMSNPDEDYHGQLVEVFDKLVDEYPDALGIADKFGEMPLHKACRSLAGRHTESIRKMIRIYPQALSHKGFGGLLRRSCTPLLTAICNGKTKVIELILDSEPNVAFIDDQRTLECYDPSYYRADQPRPAGDALDYAFKWVSKYAYRRFQINNLEGMDNVRYERNSDGFRTFPYRKGYIKAEERCLQAVPEGESFDDNDYAGISEIWWTFLTILESMYGQQPTFLPLHAIVTGRLCRPWNLIVMQKFCKSFTTDARTKDCRGNLPLHLFLESCMVEMDRAVSKGFADDNKEYQRAVTKCFGWLLEANRDATRETNSEGRLPLALAIENCSSIQFEATTGIIAKLVDTFPDALMIRDSETRLHPFALAAVGATANIDVIFHLLGSDPSALVASNIV